MSHIGEKRKIYSNLKKIRKNYRQARKNIEKIQTSLDETSRNIDEQLYWYDNFEQHYIRYFPNLSGVPAELYNGSYSRLVASGLAVSDKIRQRTESMATDFSSLNASVSSAGSLVPSIVHVARHVTEKYGTEEAKDYVIRWNQPTESDNQKRLSYFLKQIEPRLSIKLDGAWQTLKDRSKKDRFLQASSSMRELISDTLLILAPNEKVEKTPWFNKETNDGKPSQRQRAYYAMVGNNNLIRLDDLTAIEELAKDIRLSYEQLSKYAHLRKYQSDLESYLTRIFNETQIYLLKILELRERYYK